LDTLNSLVTIFLGIFLEALPFLLIGVAVSAALNVFVSDATVARWTPRHPVPAAVFGACLGLAFPVCECGSVPTSRRLVQKGAPLATGLGFMLAAPVINPVVIASTYVAFESWAIVAWRLGLTLAIAVAVAVIFSLHPNPAAVLTPLAMPQYATVPIVAGGVDLPLALEAKPTWGERGRALLVHSGEEFFEMGRFLVIGGLLAAALQTFVPQSTLLGIGRGPVISVLVMILLATALSICSTVDAFVALSFANTFTMGSIMTFLVFGPMIDIKSILMFSTVYRKWALAVIVLLVFQMSLLAGVAINLNLP
jgi:uncharacterized protein